jgi:hypothetical protein
VSAEGVETFFLGTFGYAMGVFPTLKGTIFFSFFFSNI